jgi:hypothetical protein
MDQQQAQPAHPVDQGTTTKHLSQLAKALISNFEKQDEHMVGRRVTVNPVVAKFASWYEKLRNVMEYREDEVMLRAAIERILRRMLLLGGNAKTTAAPLVRELVWARYLPDNSVPEPLIEKVESSIDLHLRLRLLVIQRHKIADNALNDLIYQMMSSDIERILRPNREKEIIANVMFHVLKEDVVISDDTEETRDAQVYMAVRKAFARDDVAFLRYHLLQLFFGKLTEHSLHQIADGFMAGYQEMLKELHYPRKERIYNFVKRRTAVFFILEDIFRSHKGKLTELVQNESELEKAVFNACDEKYRSIASKVRRAIVRSVFFILMTKVVFAFAVEGTYERFFFGHILWPQLIVNTSTPPILMLIVGLFIRTPGPDNSARILDAIKIIMYNDKPRLGDMLTLKKTAERPSIVFSLLWLLAFFISFGAIFYVLHSVHFNTVSIGIFIFFLAIVSFLSYRIALTAKQYSMGEKQGFFTPFIDFFFMPVIRVGHHLSANISKINILLFIFDFLIETPFKLLFAFFEQWFLFLHAKREELE